MILQELGWNDFFAAQLSHGTPGRVASAIREHFLVWTEEGEIEARPSGRLRHSARGRKWPCVGDWVVLRPHEAVIEQVLERKTTLSRKQPGKEMREQVLAANIHVLFIVSGLDHDYNPRRLERYLVLAEESGARPVILLNKVDLAEELGLDLQQVLAETINLSSQSPVIAVSAWSGTGLEALPA